MEEIYYKIQKLNDDIQGWTWMLDKSQKSNLNNVINEINRWLVDNFDEHYTFTNIYDDNYSLRKGQHTYARIRFNDMWVGLDSFISHSINNKIEVCRIINAIHQRLLEHNFDYPEAKFYKQTIKDYREELDDHMKVVMHDYFFDMINKGEYIPLANHIEGNNIWYKNKKRETDRITFTDFSKTGKSCKVTLYFEGEVVCEMNRYSVRTFFESNFWWVEKEVLEYCNQLTDK